MSGSRYTNGNPKFDFRKTRVKRQTPQTILDFERNGDDILL